MNIRKLCYMILGCLGLALGAVGAVLPLLPAFPFLLLAAFCFAKSSQRFHQWFLSTQLYKQNLEHFVQGRGMTMATKLRIMTVVTLTMGVGFAMMGRVPVGRIILAAVWVFHILYFLFGIPTLSPQDAAYRCCQLLKVEGMQCEHCARQLECALQQCCDVRATVDFSTSLAKIYLKEPMEPEKLLSLVRQAGYTAQPVKG